MPGLAANVLMAFPGGHELSETGLAAAPGLPARTRAHVRSIHRMMQWRVSGPRTLLPAAPPASPLGGTAPRTCLH